jgi:valyl-tRNA synthetase
VYGLSPELRLDQDEDVLDTWFSSALWPFSTLGWPDRTEELEIFYPTSVLVTGFDIIFFWVARMIMMGIQFLGDIPFREVYIHGLVRDGDGQKMSKSKGNILDPLDLIDGITLNQLVEKRTSGLMQPQMAAQIEQLTRQQFPDGIPSYGTDALRFTFASLASTGRDIRFDLGRIEGYRNFCNKLWNAARYVLMNAETFDTGLHTPDCRCSLPDRWIQSRLQVVIKSTTDAINAYRLDLAAQQLYDFVWNEYCDWYLEFAKIVIQDDDEATARGAGQTLVRVFETVLRLIHPLMPFISEEIWQRIAPLAGVEGETIVLQPYPKPLPERNDPAATSEIEWVMAVILGVRRIRGEMNIAPGKPLPVLLQNATPGDRERVLRNHQLLTQLGRIESIAWIGEEESPDAAIALVDQMKILIPMAGLIDREAELGRIEKEIGKLKKSLPAIEGKLTNPAFLAKAPNDVIEKQRALLSEVRLALDNLEQQAAKIRTM